MATPAALDPRDQLWDESFKVYYEARYQENMEDRLIELWQRIDYFIRILVALTASGSAVSGWALWTEPAWRQAWLVISSVAALGSIVHATLGVPERIKDHTETRKQFRTLRVELETFRFKMRMDAQFPVAEFTAEFIKYRTDYAEAVQRVGSDILERVRLRRLVQNELNIQLAPEIT